MPRSHHQPSPPCHHWLYFKQWWQLEFIIRGLFLLPELYPARCHLVQTNLPLAEHCFFQVSVRSLPLDRNGSLAFPLAMAHLRSHASYVPPTEEQHEYHTNATCHDVKSFHVSDPPLCRCMVTSPQLLDRVHWIEDTTSGSNQACMLNSVDSLRCSGNISSPAHDLDSDVELLVYPEDSESLSEPPTHPVSSPVSVSKSPCSFPSTITSGCSPPVTLSWHTWYCWGTGIPPWPFSRTYKTGFPPFSAFMSSIASTSTAWANSWFLRNFTWTSAKFRTATCTVLSPCVIPGIMNSFFCAKLSTGSNAKGTFAGLSILASTYTTELGGRDSFFLTTSRLIWKALALTSLRMCACTMSPLPNSKVSFPRSTLHLLPRRKSMPKINESWMSASMTSQ